MKQKILPLVIIGLVITMWASAFVGIRSALDSYLPHHLALLRYLVASSVMMLAGLFGSIRMPDKQDIPSILLIGFIGITVYHVSLNYGEITVNASAASFIVNTVPLITSVFAIIFLEEKITKMGWVGLCVGFTGVSLIVVGESTSFSFTGGAMLIVVAALSQAAFFIMQKPFLKKYKPIEFTTYVIVAGTIFMLFLSPGLINSVQNAELSDTFSVIYLGIFPGAIGYILFAWMMNRYSTSKSTSYIFLVPIMTLLLSWIFLKEFPATISLLGGGLALGGVYFYQKKG